VGDDIFILLPSAAGEVSAQRTEGSLPGARHSVALIAFSTTHHMSATGVARS